MNIYAEEGSKVIYTGENGYNLDREHANKYLKVGDVYTVDYTDVQDWSTSVYLKEFPGKCFNSAHFTDEDEGKRMQEFLDKLDHLCGEYGCEIWPTDTINARNEDGSYPTFTIHGPNDEKVRLVCIDGDGRGK